MNGNFTPEWPFDPSKYEMFKNTVQCFKKNKCVEYGFFSHNVQLLLFFFSNFFFIIIINRMPAEELTEYLIASQIDVQVRQVLDRLWSRLMYKDSNPSSKAWIGQSSIIWSIV
jgi:hypothetical protein